MGLADTAKNLQQTTASRELSWLRELRAFIQENTTKRLLEEYAELEEYSKTEAGRADGKGLEMKAIDIMERGHLAAFYEDVLKYAEQKQRKDRNGGAEKAIRAHWDQLQKMEKGIKNKYEKQRREADGDK